MKVTTTKNLKGVLELTSLGVQLSYDHTNNKPQMRTMDDRFYSHRDIQAASDLKLIKITDVKKEDSYDDDDDEFDFQEKEVILTNQTNNPIIIEFLVPIYFASLPNAKAKGIPTNCVIRRAPISVVWSIPISAP